MENGSSISIWNDIIDVSSHVWNDSAALGRHNNLKAKWLTVLLLRKVCVTFRGIFTYVYLCVGLCICESRYQWSSDKGVRSLGVGVTDNCQPHIVGTGNFARVPWKSSMGSSPQWLYFHVLKLIFYIIKYRFSLYNILSYIKLFIYIKILVVSLMHLIECIASSNV